MAECDGVAAEAPPPPAAAPAPGNHEVRVTVAAEASPKQHRSRSEPALSSAAGACDDSAPAGAGAGAPPAAAPPPAAEAGPAWRRACSALARVQASQLRAPAQMTVALAAATLLCVAPRSAAAFQHRGIWIGACARGRLLRPCAPCPRPGRSRAARAERSKP